MNIYSLSVFPKDYFNYSNYLLINIANNFNILQKYKLEMNKPFKILITK